MAKKITVELELSALPAANLERVEDFIGTPLHVQEEGERLSGFVEEARIESGRILLTARAVETDDWTPS